ncbi:MAG: polyprenol monophosphomannose synthase [Bacteroidota bacterium]
MPFSNTLVIIPTYNEANNIQRMIPRLMELQEEVDILVIDDGSPDGTAQVVRNAQKDYKERVFIVERDGKQGLGTAYVAGFKYAIAQSYDFVCEMDADFSHRPEDVQKLIREVKSGNSDLAIGSRYSNGISIINWPLSRLILSYCANIYARTITGLPVYDTTAGFKCIRIDVIKAIDLDRIRSNGYAFQIELHFRAWKAGFRISEVSIVFREREEGVSKMSKAIVREAIWRVWALKFRSWFGAL